MKTIYLRLIKDECFISAYLERWEQVTYETLEFHTLVPETINNISSMYNYIEEHSNIRRSLVVGDLILWEMKWHRIEPSGFSVVTPRYTTEQVGDNTRLVFVGVH